jgi:hypothetical protein
MNMNVKILYIVDREQYINKMSRVRFHAIQHLSKLADVTIWGPNWRKYDANISLGQNMQNLHLHVDCVICYKPSSVIGFDQLKCLKVMTYNEMWDEPYTLKEINESKPDLVICHHENDMVRYNTGLYKNISHYCKFVHIHHSAEKTIFYDRKAPYDTDILLVGAVGRHYPLRKRFEQIIKMMPDKYICKQYNHPGYVHGNAFTDIYLQDFAENIGRSKICLTCTSRYKYFLGKLIEIPMCGSVLACDLPNQDQKLFEEFMITISDKMTDQEIVDTLVYYLEHIDELIKKRSLGKEISSEWGQDRYAKLLYNEINKSLNIRKNGQIKIFVQGEDMKLDEKWICDVLKDEFIQYVEKSNNITIVNNIKDCDIIWLLAPWKERSMNKKILMEKFVITTIHHIDWDKYDEYKSYYDRIDSYTNRYHCICPKAEIDIKKITNKPIIRANFWINQEMYFNIPDKEKLRKKYNIPVDSFLIGSFQKDTEGSGMPKLSKGPDLFVKIVDDMRKTRKNIIVMLTGWRRSYITNELDKLNIPYIYHELVSLETLNELYNCLDLYIVASRVEGGPRSIMDCGMTCTPIISTDVGIAELIINKHGIFDSNDWTTYAKAYPDQYYVFSQTNKYSIKEYMDKFISHVFYETL